MNLKLAVWAEGYESQKINVDDVGRNGPSRRARGNRAGAVMGKGCPGFPGEVRGGQRIL